MVTQRAISLIFIAMLSMPVALTQQHNAASAAAKKEQIERANHKAYEKARKATLKHRREIQTKNTRKRMDDVEKNAMEYNKQNDLKWWQKLFKRHRRK